MKTLILTVTAGFGHHATARAISDMLRSKGSEVRTIDIYEYISKLVHDTISKGYIFSTKYTKEIYRLFYNLMEKKQKDDFFFNKANIIKLINTLGTSKLSKVIDDFEPDCIICTHVFSAQLINEMKARRLLDVLSVGIVTDYTLHPYWEDCAEIEYIVIANKLISYLAKKRGISENRQLPLGIPIDPKFNIKTEKCAACSELGLDSNRPTILVMTGSMGYGKITKIVQQIINVDVDFQILAVCGNNKKQYCKLCEFNQTYIGKCTIYPFGFVNNIDIMMDAADCVITKPGGLTISEALAKSLPMILINPIPGQEERNVEFLINNGIALLVTKTFTLDQAVYHMFTNKTRIQTINSTIKEISCPNAAKNLADFLIEKIENQQK